MTHNLAQKYSQESSWQFKRGMELLALSGIKSGDTVLDIGCGTGELTLEIAKRVGPTGKVMGIDIDKNRCKIAQQAIPEHINNVCYQVLDAHQIRLVPSHSIDVVFSNYVFHWIEDKPLLLEQIKACLKPEGYLVAELVGELTLTLQALTAASGSAGLAVLDKFCCHNLKQWEAYLIQAGFNINELSWPKHDYHFNSLNRLFDWWESSTHGGFNRNNIATNLFMPILERFQGEINFSGYSCRMVARNNPV
jgi:ubiquinone/menaquinone biosynthesis C-methylase UbiE